MAKAKQKHAQRPNVRFEHNTDLLVYAAVFIAWYIYLFVTLQTSPELPYDLSGTIVTLLQMTVAAPFLIIWFLGVYAYVRTISYSRALKGWEDGPAFRRIAHGILFLLAGMILPTILSSLDNFLALSGTAETAVSITISYARIFPYLFGFIFFFDGIRRLNASQSIALSVKKTLLFLGLLLIPAFVWLELIFAGPVASETIYNLRDSLIILTIVIPSLLMWAVGTVTALSFHTYAQQVKGVVYNKALHSFVIGIGAVIVASIMLQTIVSLGSEQLLALRLRQLLGIIYAFLLLQGVGYLFMARGAKKLTKIEVV